MTPLPGARSDVYFGDPDAPPSDWRAEMKEGGPGDDDDAEPTDEDRAAVILMLGFDPRDPMAGLDDDEDEGEG